MLSFLPAALFILLLASPGGARGISNNDPFRAIAVTVTKHNSPPVCCLKALTPVEPLDDEVLLSFEEWKKKQTGKQGGSRKETVGNDQTLTAGNESASNPGDHNASASPDSNVSAGYISGSLQPSDVAPHFRVPTTDRFNYASMDCSARVHISHRSAKSPSSILSSKKDRYMLSPCNSGREKQFVVVELCDDIRIDTVQLANFEFFSGVFKDFTVSVAKTYSIGPDGWSFAGTYKAKNVRGVQSFHPPTSLGDFYRFIRIDFLSHYGNEYYCPISLLRVYGLTHLEEWKWDIWQAESRAKLEKSAVQVIPISSSVEDASTGKSVRKSSYSVMEPPATSTVVPHETEEPSSTSAGGAASPTIVIATQTSIQPESDIPHSTVESSSAPSGSSHSSKPPYDPSRSNTPLQLLSHRSVPESAKSHEPVLSSSAQSQVHSSNHSTISIPSSTVIPSHSSIPSVHPSASTVQVQPPPPPVPPTGESIYRTIMNRLSAVENNQTLYMKYVEQQNGAMRDVIRRLGEDVGRLEGITRAQGVALQKAFNDWEKQRYQLQMEYKDILKRMEILSHEVILEKRLGVAQLCLLLAVLIFLGLTRGSRANELYPVGQPSSRSVKSGGLREWGRRHLSWTGYGSSLAEKSSENAVREGWKKGSDGRNSSRDRMRGKLDMRTPVKRPKPLVLGPSNANNILRVFDGDKENSNLPFPSSEPLLPHTTIGTTMDRPQTSMLSHSRSRAGSGTATPLYSAPVAGNGHGTSRKMAFQRPVTPISRSQFVFRTPQKLQRSHSFNRSITPIGSAAGPVKASTPLPMSQTLSWGAFGAVPKSAKNWARTAHLHDVKSAKKRQEQERARSTGKNRRETEEDDALFGSSKTQPSSIALMHLDDAPEVVSTQRSLLLELVPDLDIHHKTPSIHIALPVEDESDLWVDTDSASVDDGNAETLDFPFLKS